VQFWYQNRRQRDARALKAAQLMAASGAPEGTSHAESILEQLRTLNEARRTLGIHQQPCARAPRPAASTTSLAGYPMGPTAYCASTAAAMGLVPLASMSAAQMAAGAPPPYFCYPGMAHMAHPPTYALPEEHPLLLAGHPVPARMMPQQAMMTQQPPMAGHGHMGHLAPGLQLAMGLQPHPAHLLQGPMMTCNPHMPPHMQQVPAHPGPPGYLGHPNAAMVHYGAVPHHLPPGQHAQVRSPDGPQPYPMGPHSAAVAVTSPHSGREHYPHPNTEMTLGHAPAHEVQCCYH